VSVWGAKERIHSSVVRAAATALDAWQTSSQRLLAAAVVARSATIAAMGQLMTHVLRVCLVIMAFVVLDGCGEEAPPEGEGTGQRATEDQQARERAEAQRRRRETAGRSGLVTRVIDGDTIELEGVGRVRLIGVDTPERGEECFEEASAYLEQRVGGQTVRYRYQQERTDRYDRALLDIFRGGELVNLDIAQAGWGQELTIAPNDRYARRIAAAEQDARAEPRGRWAGCVEEPQPPPEPEPEPAPSPPSQEDDDQSGGGASGGGGVPSGTCSEIDITDFPVPPGDPRDRDGDGIACES